MIKGVALVMALIVLAVMPYLSLPTFGILPGRTNEAGSLQLLSMVLTIAALAVTFDLLLGQTGLLSFGHALYFALGSYSFVLLLTFTEIGFWIAALLAVLITAAVSVVLNAIALRVEGIAYAMITLAFAQLAGVMVSRNYFGTGGEEGLRLPFGSVPDPLVGLGNISNVYWLSLASSVLVVVVVLILLRTQLGLVLQGIRENALRMRVMGFGVSGAKLTAAVIASGLAGLCGVTYAVVLGGADPSTTALVFALSLIFMVVIGGSGSVLGAVLGGVLYTVLANRLPVVGDQLEAAGLPNLLAHLLGEPAFLLGAVFLVIVFFAPQGIVGLFARRTKVTEDEVLSISEIEESKDVV